ncbi:peptide chain release factor N(5)-glutamine methyltransferase [Halomonas sp. McH1-25]|uniref:peptide chain release factor N(5)-glutamine methyltransferase n=1 Tax=unclassified Halomonas TaxID=2609666 RepID=UPI001EF6BFB6|nr:MULTISPECIES: peptide chain release factor N(5)-glutamine methyltransferase [unclassified Halomonas]MCG7599028.1 peptide chain release factor N(5)-glutamine methyltransferase [Halomonas sp. McH1-25]MCP1343743.1 peptide chain release factor N(5)-glutamine methyltransferase [Halomonas sp. FL8]MCP1360325.1 peptide chain release factor N(5)-glutamine methyltransferase [Halomonas sp. BBD45]MCP1364267.1 peptide chain release factor N(5)-glutamine methyltransferase [Halomonas sp. BBD48]
MRIDLLLAEATRRLALAGSASPRLDAEVLLGHALARNRTWLYTWGDRDVTQAERARFESLLAARETGQPVAYLTGEREFWGLSLHVGRATLIPRPDTESLVEAALDKAAAKHGRALDLGTGSGAIALAFASERPDWHVVGVDRVPGAVALARRNGERLGLANASFVASDWFAALAGERFELILSNPPYLAADDPHLDQGDVRFEPRSALVADDRGLADLHYLCRAARAYLAPQGWLLLEHGMSQDEAVRDALIQSGYREVQTRHDLGGRPRVTLGCLVP